MDWPQNVAKLVPKELQASKLTSTIRYFIKVYVATIRKLNTGW